MGSAKELLERLVANMPDERTWEDAASDALLFVGVAQGMNDVVSGRAVSQDEAERRSEEWLPRQCRASPRAPDSGAANALDFLAFRRHGS